jgi:hypothetical protein
MRTKKRTTLATPDLTAAWANFYASTKEDDMQAYAAQGWKTLTQITEESGLSMNTITHRVQVLIRQKVFEKKIVRGMTNNGVRAVAIYRPTPTASQQRANTHANH